MSPLVLALAAAGLVALALLGTLGVVTAWRRDRGTALRPRLRRVAAPLAGSAPVEAQAAGEQSIFRRTGGRSRLARLHRLIESRYPLLDVRRALLLAAGAGFAAAAAAWFSIWFLRVPVGGWILPVCGLAGTGGAWYALRWRQARQEAAFVREFPEIVDHMVRLAGAGVPGVEALAVAAQDAPPSIRPTLTHLCDTLLAGVETDTALRMATERVRLAEFTMFASVLRLQRRSGSEISTAFANLSKTLRDRHKTSLKAHASTAQSRLTLLVLAGMPVVVLLVQKFMAPATVEVLFDTERGNTLLQVGVGLIVAGLLAARAVAGRAGR